MSYEGRAAIGYDHGYDAEKFYMGLALDERYVEAFIEGSLERIGEDDSDGANFLRELLAEGEIELVLETLKAECEVLPGRASG